MSELAPKYNYSDKPDNHLVQKYFGQSSNRYLSVAHLQRLVGNNLIEMVKLKSADRVLDLGSGPGTFTSHLKKTAKELVSFDLSDQMLECNPSENRVQGDSHSLPFLSESFDLIFSSLMIQWCDFRKVSEQIYHCLKPGASALVSTLATGTLKEYQSAWQGVDDDNHIYQYLSQDHIIKHLHSLPWRQVQIEKKEETMWYPSVRHLAKELKSLGANYVKDRKNTGLVTPHKWKLMEQHYHGQFFCSDRKQYPATYNVIYIKLEK